MKYAFIISCLCMSSTYAIHDFDLFQVKNESQNPLYGAVYIVYDFDGRAELFQNVLPIPAQASTQFERPIIMPGQTRYFVLSGSRQRLEKSFDAATFAQLNSQEIESLFEKLKDTLIIEQPSRAKALERPS